MNRISTTLMTTALVLITASATHAHVVIESIDVGGAALDKSMSGGKGKRGKATGEVDAVTSGDISDEFSFKTPSQPRNERKGNSRNQRANDRRERFPRANVSRGGGGGGGGGGGRRGGGTSRSSDDLDIVQTVVTVGDSDSDISNTADDEGTDLTTFNDDSSLESSLETDAGSSEGGSSSSGSGSGGGGDNGGNGGIGGNGGNAAGPTPRITGTPEPTSLVVWTLVGCCGYGLVRFRNGR